MAGAIFGSGAAVYTVCLRDTIQRAGCVIRQSGSERGAAVQTAVPTRQGPAAVVRVGAFDAVTSAKRELRAPRRGASWRLSTPPRAEWLTLPAAGQGGAG